MHPQFLEGDYKPRERVYDLLSLSRNRNDRGIDFSRSRSLLCLLGADAHSHVPSDRRLGESREAGLRRHQVLSLYHGRKRVDADRHPRPLLHQPEGDRAAQLRCP